MAIRWKIVTLQGFNCMMELKRSWGVTYKSLDGGFSWHKSIDAAYREALRNGMLRTTSQRSRDGEGATSTADQQ